MTRAFCVLCVTTIFWWQRPKGFFRDQPESQEANRPAVDKWTGLGACRIQLGRLQASTSTYPDLPQGRAWRWSVATGCLGIVEMWAVTIISAVDLETAKQLPSKAPLLQVAAGICGHSTGTCGPLYRQDEQQWGHPLASHVTCVLHILYNIVYNPKPNRNLFIQ